MYYFPHHVEIDFRMVSLKPLTEIVQCLCSVMINKVDQGSEFMLLIDIGSDRTCYANSVINIITACQSMSRLLVI